MHFHGLLAAVGLTVLGHSPRAQAKDVSSLCREHRPLAAREWLTLVDLPQGDTESIDILLQSVYRFLGRRDDAGLRRCLRVAEYWGDAAACDQLLRYIQSAMHGADPSCVRAMDEYVEVLLPLTSWDSGVRSKYFIEHMVFMARIAADDELRSSVHRIGIIKRFSADNEAHLLRVVRRNIEFERAAAVRVLAQSPKLPVGAETELLSALIDWRETANPWEATPLSGEYDRFLECCIMALMKRGRAASRDAALVADAVVSDNPRAQSEQILQQATGELPWLILHGAASRSVRFNRPDVILALAECGGPARVLVVEALLATQRPGAQEKERASISSPRR